MANENTIKTRIQLKCDTEDNWNKSALIADGGTKEEGNSFIPKKGEAIIYSADGTHIKTALGILVKCITMMARLGCK